MGPYAPARNDDEPAPGPCQQQPRHYTTAQLFSTAREIAIEHEGATYRLRITRQGKLILNK